MRTLLLARSHLGAMAVLALLTLSACLLVAALPRAMQASFDAALHQSLRDAAAQQVDLTVQVESRGQGDDLREPSQFTSRDGQFRSLLPAELRRLVAPAGTATSHMSAKTYDTPVYGAGGLTYINLAWLSDGDRRVGWIEGRAPGGPATMRWHGSDIPLFEVGVVEESRTKMGLGLGDVRVLGESAFVAIKVVGVFSAKQPDDPYWTHNAEILHVTEVQPPGKAELERRTTALISPAALTKLSGGDRNLVYSWIMGVDPDAPDSLDVSGVSAAVGAYERAVVIQPMGSTSRYTLATRLPELLAVFSAQLGTARTVMFLALGGLLAVGLGVIVLAVQLLTGRANPALSLARARGASLRQVAATGSALTALAVLPAAPAGYALSWLVPGPALWFVHAGPALVALTAIGYAAARVAVTHRAPLLERRDDLVSARPSARRITLEVLVVALALAGAYLLRTRGLATRAGDDPFLLLVPVALTVAAALITIRCYPYPLRLLVRLAARGRPAVPFLGLTTAARGRPAGMLPVLILLPALGVSVFAAVVSGGLASTQRLASWQSAGAPIKVTSAVDLPPGVVERVRRVPGVDLVVPAETGQVQVGYSGERAEVIAVDLAQWRRVLDGAPIAVPAPPAPPAAGSGVPALVSSELRGRGEFEIGWYARLKVTTHGVMPSLPGFYQRGKFIVLPFDTPRPSGVNTLLISGDADPAAVLKAAGQPRAQVTSQAGALRTITGDPLTATIHDVLLITTLALAGYALVAVIVTLVIGAADRARALSFLRTLGLSDRQARGLTVLEILPLVVVSSLAGLALGLVLPAALGPGIDLSAYAGDVPMGAYDLDPALPAVLAAGLAAVAVLGAYAHAAVNRRGLGTVLRVGDLA